MEPYIIVFSFFLLLLVPDLRWFVKKIKWQYGTTKMYRIWLQGAERSSLHNNIRKLYLIIYLQLIKRIILSLELFFFN